MSVLEKILTGIRQRRAAESDQASQTYAGLVLRLASGKANPADTPEHVDVLLARSDLGPDDLAHDVAAAQAHYRLRQSCRSTAAVRAESREAADRWAAAVDHERAEAVRLRAESLAGHRASIEADGRAREIEGDLARVLAVASEELASGYRTADAAWRAALDGFDRAKQNGDADAAAAHEREAAAARAAVDKALAALLAFDPTPAALRAVTA